MLNIKFGISDINRFLRYVDKRHTNLPQKMSFPIQRTYKREIPPKITFWKFDTKQYFFYHMKREFDNMNTTVILRENKKKMIRTS